MVLLLRNKDYYGIGLFLLLAVMVGYQKLVSPAIGIFLLIVIVEAVVLKSLHFKFSKVTFLFVLLFVFYLLGLLWAEHRDVGLKLLEYKMSFFIFPIIFLLKKERTNAWLILQGLVWGSIFLAFQFFYGAYFGNEISYYEISRNIVELHPTYASVYFTMAAVFLVYGYVSKEISWPLLIIIPLVLVFCYLVFLIGSFAAILFLALSFAIGFGMLIYTWLKWKGLLLYFFIVPVLLYFTIAKMDQLAYDREMANAVYNEIAEGKKSFIEKNKLDPSGTKSRVTLWLISAEIIEENPFGVGTGDIDFFLSEKCDQYDLQLLKQSNLNPHNQYLQIGIDLGFPGIILLFVLIESILYVAINNKNYFLFFLGFSLFFNALFESVLQRQSGIVFYTSLMCIVLVYNDQLKWKEKSVETKMKRS